MRIIFIDKYNNLLLDDDGSEDTIVSNSVRIVGNEESMVVQLKNDYNVGEKGIKIVIGEDGEVLYEG